MEIPEITPWQMNVLHKLSHESPTVMICVPEKDDPQDVQVERQRSNAEMDQMRQLELVENANKDGMFDGMLAGMKAQTSRTWRIFQLTHYGRMLYIAFRNPIVH